MLNSYACMYVCIRMYKSVCDFNKILQKFSKGPFVSPSHLYNFLPLTILLFCLLLVANCCCFIQRICLNLFAPDCGSSFEKIFDWAVPNMPLVSNPLHWLLWNVKFGEEEKNIAQNWILYKFFVINVVEEARISKLNLVFNKIMQYSNFH